MDEAIIATGGNYAFILGVSPGDLPDRSIMCLESVSSLILLAIISHAANLQEAITVTACNLSSIVIELTIIDIIFMLGVDRDNFLGI